MNAGELLNGGPPILGALSPHRMSLLRSSYCSTVLVVVMRRSKSVVLAALASIIAKTREPAGQVPSAKKSGSEALEMEPAIPQCSRLAVYGVLFGSLSRKLGVTSRAKLLPRLGTF